jgi:dTDP-4-amino-4,6-dideoxygalactose transaminase
VSEGPLYVTRPLLPPLDEFLPYLEKIWAGGQVTNGGAFHRHLEAALAKYLDVEHISLFANGTLALLTAVKTLDLSGEVITTPFSFVATAHALLWNGITPVFADIDADTLNLDPSAVEAAITPRTAAILPVHVYGRPCDVRAIQRIANEHGLRVVYDAAHAFGVRCKDTNLLRWGDLSILSFHATKVFHTFEGGAIVCPDAQTKQRVDRLKNFGFAGETSVVALGINGKMNELQAAFGLLHLQHMDSALARRREIDTCYRRSLADVAGIRCLPLPDLAVYNYGYFPVRVEAQYPLGREGLYLRLRESDIHARRYFYPLISDFPMYRSLPSAAADALPVARRVAEEILCLPIYPDMSEADCARVVAVIREAGDL